MTATGRQGDTSAEGSGLDAARPIPPHLSELRVVLRELVASMCGVPVDELDDTRPLPEYGLTSRDAIDLSGRLEDLLNTSLPATLLWENPTIEALLDHLTPGHEHGQDRQTAADDDALRTDAVPIAVVGIGCRLPGKINGPEAFWQQLLAGTDAVGRVPDHRWRGFDNGTAETAAVLERICRWGGFLDDVEGFDADFFGITPREAEVMDPQQRLLLEVGCEALDHAGIGAASLQGSATGVFVGISALEYGHLTNADVCRVTAWTSTGAAGSIVANRMSYLLDLRGPSMTIDSACSSSLVAVHQACRSLRSGESHTALAAGINVMLSPATTATFDQAGALAADGRCKPFDAGADGITRGEGCGVVVLKRLPDAQRDGDRILAVIRGSAVNSDGRSAGLMAPNPHAQRALLQSALRDARAEALDVDYVEAHGTGTLLGDPIEADALGDVLGEGRTADRPLLIGSVKSNLGHLEGAAGIVGLIKTVLSLHHGQLPATLHFQRPNPHIDFTGLGLRVVTEATPWPRRPHTPALAGVSAFGFGGTNAHVVLEEAPPPAMTAPVQSTTAHPEAADSNAPHVLLVTARSKDRLRDVATSLAHRLASKDAPALTDLAYTLAHLNRGPVSAGVVGRTSSDLVGALAALVREEAVPAVIEAGTRADRPGSRRAVFVFSGYGSQWSGMGRRLLQEDQAFAAAVTRMDPAFAAELGTSLTDLITQEQGTSVDRVQPLLFGVQVALADTVRAHGVTPAAVIGHSMGEVSAAVVAGALTLPDGLRVMRHRSLQLTSIDEEHTGAMAAIELRDDERDTVLSRYPGVDIAVYASPQRCTVAGPSDPVRQLTEDLTEQGQLARLLAVGGAGHSRAVDPILPALREALDPLQARTPAVAWYSTVLDDPRTPVHPDADYWCANARQPVRFQQAVTAAAADGHDLFLEIAPHPVAAVPLAETLAAVSQDDTLVVPTLHKNGDDTVNLFTALARLHLAGVADVGQALWPGGKRTPVPTPPWRHVKHWFPAGKAYKGTSARGGHALIGLRVDDPVTGRTLWHGDVGTALDRQQPRKLYGRPVLSLSDCAQLLFAAAVDMRRSDLTAVRIEDLIVHQWLPLSASTPITTVWQPSGPHQAAVTIHSRSASGTWLCHASARVVNAPQRLEGDRRQDASTGTTLHWKASTDAQSAPDRRPLAQLLDVLLHAPASMEAAGAELDPNRPASVGERAAASLRSLQLQRTAVDDEYHIRCELSTDGHAPAVDEYERQPQDNRWDIWAASMSGQADIVAHGVQMRAVQQSEVPTPLDHITYDIQWTKTNVGVPHPPHSILLLTDSQDADRQQLTAPLAAALDDKGMRVTIGEYHHDSIATLLDDWRHRAGTDRTAVAMLFKSPQPASEAPSHEVQAAAHVARLLLSAPSQTPAPRLWLVTRNAVGVAPGEVPHPDQACLRGFIRAMALERPELRACLVDIAAQPALEDDLVQELVADGDADEVAWRAGTRLVARLSPADLSEPYDSVPFARPDGAYILTGGLTGLGLATARRLAENGAGRIVLNGRRAPDAQAAQTLTELADLGASVSVVQGDIAEPRVAQRLVQAAEAEGHVLRGVAHAAGVLHDRVVTDLQSCDIVDVFRPKVMGALQLEAATNDHDLDWWLFYSSAAALLGSPGQAAYAAANAWLDAMANRRRAAGRPATAIAWGPWAQVGGAPADNPALPLEPIALSEGLDALQALVTCVRPYTGVVHLDGNRALRAFPGLQDLPFFADVLSDEADLGEDWIGPDGIAQLGDAAASKVLERLAKRTAAVMGFAAHELNDNVALTDLGLDSLMTVRIQNATRHDFAVEVPPTLLLRGASLRDLGAAVLSELNLQVADLASPTEGLSATSAQPCPAPQDTHPPLPTTIGPRDAAERLVASVWGHVLGSRPGSVNDDFVTVCGGPHEVRALTEGIRKRLGDSDIALTEEQVLNGPTVAAIAEIIRPAVNGTGNRIVRTLRPAPQGSSRPPLFTFHPAGGPTSVYRPLVQLLHADQPVYGFERIEEAASLEAKATRYLGIMKDLQPEGPYHLLGWSFGGCLAYEVARQLHEQGQDVSFLGLIDTILPAALPGLDSKMLLERFGRFVQYIEQTYGHRLELPYEELANTADEEQIDVVLRLVADAGLSMSHGILEHQRTSYIDARVGERYQPKPYEGHVVLYRAQEAQPLTTALDPRYLRSEADLGWAPLCPSLEIVPVPGDHLSLIDPPFVEVIAEHLTQALDEAGG
ncbi:phthiocerol/phenolphthiocerol synthesis type-I polyketide synthase D [Streptomyces sp. B4I13]|uniref:SDR family NAD(P)-dependent oxidoreductase n=1 Tax=Streptomyces sp. B4I13 TaxID=3042271 RepID=UPI002786088E|nr:SDR family NAD(P)-dependent oxidoreductase [Streptomyces sp. B4I13]MDQ0956315.1 phthiocerol/phenolphthiocerol synthesis type-I polyketide synthase D [Streptomyces sp. B4I13]